MARQNNNRDRATFELYVVEEGKPDSNGETRAFWNKVGRGFENQDGSLSLRLFMHPGLLIQCRKFVPREEREGNDRRDNRNNGGRR